MVNVIDKSTYFNRKYVKGLKWLNKNPYEASTDRELFVLHKNMPVYRAMYTRNETPLVK